MESLAINSYLVKEKFNPSRISSIDNWIRIDLRWCCDSNLDKNVRESQKQRQNFIWPGFWFEELKTIEACLLASQSLFPFSLLSLLLVFILSQRSVQYYSTKIKRNCNIMQGHFANEIRFICQMLSKLRWQWKSLNDKLYFKVPA